MTNLPSDVEHPPQHSTATLGDVLYAKPQSLVPEREWVMLPAAVAAQDHRALLALYDRAHHLVFTYIFRSTADERTAEALTLDVFHDVWCQASDYNATSGTVLAWIMNLARARAEAPVGRS